jgi:hypothetical protein
MRRAGTAEAIMLLRTKLIDDAGRQLVAEATASPRSAAASCFPASRERLPAG